MKLAFSAFLLSASVAQAAENMAQDSTQPQLVEVRDRSRFLQSASESIDFGGSTGNGCVDYEPDGSWTQIPRNDDGSYFIEDIGIDFPWVGGTRRSLYINNNGNLSFDHGIRSYSPSGLTAASENMIAVFWADVDTRHLEDGFVWYKTTADNKFVVVWEEVARYGASSDTANKNTFQVVLADDMYVGRHICFCYEEMTWTTGSASGGRDASVGIADGTGDTFFLGSFAAPGNSWAGLGTTGNDVSYLASEQSFCFDQGALVTPPTMDTICGGPLIPPETGICYSADTPQAQACATYCTNSGYDSHLVVDNGVCECHIANTCEFPRCDYAQISDYHTMAFIGEERHFRYEIDLDGDYMQYDLESGDIYRVGGLRIYDTPTSAHFTGGDDRYCGFDRSARVFMNTNPDITEPTLTEVSEPSICYYEARFDVPCSVDCPITIMAEFVPMRRCESTVGGNLGTGGDPHVTTWANEHYEYHGQCDLVLTKDEEWADGAGLEVHIRTKLVRYWSYIKSVAIKIGNDILEIEGSADADDAEAHYWINFEYQGELEEFAGFPVTQELPSVYKRRYHIDLSSKYPGTSIVVELYKEFVRVRFNGDTHAFANTVGLMGDYKTGNTLARDGTTVMNDFTEFGDEWQVLPSEAKLFHEISHPQFPELCIKPEDPRGDRQRRLAESTISIEQAEAACATLKDPLTIKDCVYDILATQDMDMVGAF